MTIKRLLIASALIISNTAIAGTVISFQGNNPALNSDIYVQDGKVSMSQQMGGMITVSVFDSAKNHFVNINHNEKTYMVIDEASMQQAMGQMNQAMQQMQAQLAQMPPEQRKMMEQQLKAMGMPTEAPNTNTQAKITRTGKQKSFKINNATISCEVIKIDNTSSACIADVSNTPMSTADYATLNKMFDYSSRLAQQIGRAAGSQAVPPKMDGVPLEFTDSRSKTSSRIVSMKSANINTSAFAIPAGYQKISMTPQ